MKRKTAVRPLKRSNQPARAWVRMFAGDKRPELCSKHVPRKKRVQETPGARCTRSRVRSVDSTRVSHHRFTGTPGISCAMVLTAYFALSPVTGLSCHCHP
jgi:hypothetical protein